MMMYCSDDEAAEVAAVFVPILPPINREIQALW